MGAGEGRGLLGGDGSWAPASSGVCPKPPLKPRVEHRKRYRIAQPRKSPSEDCRATLQVRARWGPASPVASCLLPLAGGPAASPWRPLLLLRSLPTVGRRLSHPGLVQTGQILLSSHPTPSSQAQPPPWPQRPLTADDYA